MRTRQVRLWFVFAVIASFAITLVHTGSPAADAQYSPGSSPSARYIVTFDDAGGANAYAYVLSRASDVRIDQQYSSALHGFAGKMPSRIAAALAADPAVRSVEPDVAVRTNVEDLPTGIDRIEAEPPGDINATGPDTDVDIAIIDTGIDLDHADLRVAGGFASYGVAEVLLLRLCGLTDTFDDGNGHGTHVSGTAAARDNSIGVVGVAPGARLWAIRVLGPAGTGCLSDVIAGVDWVTDNAATIEVANMSLGSSSSSPALCSAIANSVAAGVTYAVAAGNDGANASGTSPANCADVIATSAIADYDGAAGGGAESTCTDAGADDSFATFSNFGAVVDVAAPGVCIYSTYMGGGYDTLSGTSMASPHTAGAVARFIAQTGYGGQAGPGAVLAALNAAGWLESQTGACGFTGDPDATHEPLIHPGAACNQ